MFEIQRIQIQINEFVIYPIHIGFDTANLSSAEAPAGYPNKNTVEPR